eukprot:SAG11_NODE_522_length_8776_cov_6.087242_7_plen_70_part_00
MYAVFTTICKSAPSEQFLHAQPHLCNTVSRETTQQLTIVHLLLCDRSVFALVGVSYFQVPEAAAMDAES